MKYISTRKRAAAVDFDDALIEGLAPDGGLYVPDHFPKIDPSVTDHLANLSLHALGDAIMSPFLTEISRQDLHSIIHRALNFPIPLIHLEDNLYLLEVFHGPTLAFKDVGARFMANMLAYPAVSEDTRIKIIVATSGDTGSAIASAFHHMPNIDVYILYPSGKISRLQEQQITTFGGNIHALEVAGTFDDCQHLVKTALADERLRENEMLTTANSINIARLLPQMIYHCFGLVQLQQQSIRTAPIIVVPSGNLGNLTSAVYAKKMGFPIKHFIAATNINTTFPDYLFSASFIPKPSKKTYANAMDVGNPSNFERLQDAYQNDHKAMCADITGTPITDTLILEEIKRTRNQCGYILDPHTAIGVCAARKTNNREDPIIITATAHPAKFAEVITAALGIEIPLPDQLRLLIDKPKQAEKISIDYRDFYNTLKK